MKLPSPVLLAQGWRHVLSSYWFFPALMVAGAVVLSFVTGFLDQRVGPDWLRDYGFLFDSRPEGARAVLSAIAGSMITVAGVTFSTTMVSVSFAAGQFGPRLIGNFMRDRGNQITLGVFIATFVYCLMILRSVRGAESGDGPNLATAFVPHVSMLVSLVLALACVSVLIYFIHHVPETINVGRITSDLGHQLLDDLTRLFPEQKDSDSGKTTRSLVDYSADDWKSGVPMMADRYGYIQAIDLDAVQMIATNHGLAVRLEYRPGDFANRGVPLLYAKPASEVSDEVIQSLREQIVIGRERTSTQNVTYLVDQLIEIMARALSPGVNDPYTAINCIKWLGCALNEASKHDATLPHRFDEEGEVRVVIHPLDFERFASAIFDRSMQYVSSDRNASLELMRVTAEAAVHAENDDRTRLLTRYAIALNTAAQENLPLEADRAAVASRLATVTRLIESESTEHHLRDDQGWFGGRG